MIKTNDIDDLLENGANSKHFENRLMECRSSYPIPGFNYDSPIKLHTDVCVDIGANLGCFSILGSRVFKKVFALEPVKQNLNFINKIIDDFSLNNISTYKLGVSNNNKDVKIYNLHGDSGGCSIYKGYANDQQKEYEFENIEVINFPTLFTKLNIDLIDYLKIDCEGAEFEFLYNQDMSNVRLLAIEVHGSPPDCNVTQSEFLRFLCNNFKNIFARNNLFFGINRETYNVNETEKIIEKEFNKCYQEMFAWNE
jgi:FkbM family methyltransferase